MIYCAIILSILFLLSGIMSSSVLLIIASVLFAPSHIVTSYRNAKWDLQLGICKLKIDENVLLCKGVCNMSENFNSHIACEGTDNDINWVCKVCKDLPNYAGMYLYQREREKNQLKNVKDRCADLILMKYYYALLHLLDKIHELHECPNPENDVPKYADRKCSTPECFVYYRYI